jgi:hypothetical protein
MQGLDFRFGLEESSIFIKKALIYSINLASEFDMIDEDLISQFEAEISK